MFKKNNAAPQGLNIIIVGCGKVGITLIVLHGLEFSHDRDSPPFPSHCRIHD